jgi:hypothetical protein
MSIPPVPCPNCGLPWPQDATVCPNCGFIHLPLPEWPPQPLGQMPPSALGQMPSSKLPETKLLTGNATGDIWLGLGISVAPLLIIRLLSSSFKSHFFYEPIVALPPILYFVLRRRDPVLARGLGFGVLIGLALILLVIVGVVLLGLGIMAFCAKYVPNH